jgi:hypothetical protein
MVRIHGQCEYLIADQLTKQRNKELSIVKMKVWADFSATRKHC